MHLKKMGKQIFSNIISVMEVIIRVSFRTPKYLRIIFPEYTKAWKSFSILYTYPRRRNENNHKSTKRNLKICTSFEHEIHVQEESDDLKGFIVLKYLHAQNTCQKRTYSPTYILFICALTFMEIICPAHNP